VREEARGGRKGLPQDAVLTIIPEVDVARFTVNGKAVESPAVPDTPLLWVLREDGSSS